MNDFLSLSLNVETTTSFYESTAKGEDITSIMGYLFDMIFGIMKDFVQFLRGFKFFGEVSYFDFFVALMIMSIVITYLLNVARNPGVETTSTTRARERRNAAAAERKNRDDYREYKHDRYQRVSKVRVRGYNDWKEYNNR